MGSASGQNLIPNVLILDDEVEIADLLSMFLSDDFNVTTANDPRVACELIKRNSFDLIISDVMMPHMTGLEFLQFSKKHLPQVPVVLITGHAQSFQDLKNATALGASGLLPKPFAEPKQLIDCFLKVVADSKNSLQKIHKKQKVLAIDDELELLEILTILLEDTFEVVAITDPQEVEAELEKYEFVAVFCDLNMPNASGVKVIEQVKRIKPNTPIFIMSGHSMQDEQVKKGLAAGAVDLIPKPFPEGPELLALIRKHVK